LRAQSTCPTLPAAADKALNEIAALQAAACAADRKTIAAADQKSEIAIRAALAGVTCDAARNEALARVAKLEDDARQQELACVNEKSEFLSVDQFTAKAHEQLDALRVHATCVTLRDEIDGAIKAADDRASSAQKELARLGCYAGSPSGKFDDGTVVALAKYLSARHAPADAPRITDSFIDELQDQDEGVCPLPQSQLPTAHAPEQPIRRVARPTPAAEPIKIFRHPAQVAAPAETPRAQREAVQAAPRAAASAAAPKPAGGGFVQPIGGGF
jgi:hypothetical protein